MPEANQPDPEEAEKQDMQNKRNIKTPEAKSR